MSAHTDILLRHLDRLAAGGRRLSAWWRDDDAVAATPALDRLLGLARDSGVPVALAVIPGRLQPSLPARLRDDDRVDVLVHGYVHANHAGPGAKSAEFGPDRPADVLERELREAKAIIHAAFGRAVPIFVPPWNRYGASLPGALARTGFAAISDFASGPSELGGVARIPTHLDPVAWQARGGLITPDALDGQLRRTLVDATDTIGVLTHHLCFDETLWQFTTETLQVLSGHPSISWRSAGELTGRETSVRAAAGREFRSQTESCTGAGSSRANVSPL